MQANTIQGQLIQSLEKYAEKVAIESGKRTVTYSWLDKQSDMIASRIILKGLDKESIIGVLTNNRIDLIYTIIGILKAGCAFMPLDPFYPVKRLEAMIEKAEVALIFADQNNLSKLEGTDIDKVEIIEKDQKDYDKTIDAFRGRIQYEPDDIIYIYFTSGTSGKPKAIAGRNKGLLHFINWEISTFSIDDTFCVSQFTSPCHDPFLRDIFVPLCAGGKVCIPEKKEIIFDTYKMIDWIDKSGIGLIHCTPSLFRVFNSDVLTGENFKNLRYVLLAGEKIVPRELDSWYKIFGERIQLVNLYGPTETTLAKTFYLINPTDVMRKNMPVGKPIKGCRVIILNQSMKICSPGEIGELYIRTPFRSLGYYNDPELNALNFIVNPFNNDSEDIIYKTGDLGRQLADGNIELVGRVDKQVKIRGFRVELGEIENELLNNQHIRECAVVFRQDDNISNPMDQITYCPKCGMPSTYPDIKFDKEGICDICRFYEEYRDKADAYFKTIPDLKNIFEKAKEKRTGEYDCMLLYSGGKDSTYVLYKLVEMGVKVLAYTFDNGYISEVALENIKSIVNELKVDHIIDTSKSMKRIFLEGLKEEISVCNGCFKVLRIRSTKLAYEKGIKHIVTGFSRGQIFDLRLSPILKQNIFDIQQIEQKVFEQRLLYHVKADYVSSLLDNEAVVDKKILSSIELIDFYRYSDVTKKEILDFLKEKSSYWYNPSDTGFCSSNCLINDVGIYLQRKDRGYDNYTYPTSWEIRTGHISLEDAQKELKGEIDLVKVKNIMKELGYEENFKLKGYTEGYIAAYFTSEMDISASELGKHLERKLPDYMIPSYFIKLDQVPLTPNGKLDYRALPDPKKSLKKEYVAPETEVERKLEKIWCEILDIPRAGRDDNFLKIGGHSLKIMSLISKIYQEFEVEIPLGQVFNDATLKGIADYIKSAQKSIYMSIEPVKEDGIFPKGYYPASSAQKRMFILNQLESAQTSYNTPGMVIIRGNLDREKLNRAFKALIQRHEALRTAFEFVEGELLQRVFNNVDFEVDYAELDEPDLLNTEDISPRLKCLEHEFIKPFDLSKAPLFRAKLLKLHHDEKGCMNGYALMYDMHHIISDGTSIGILTREFTRLYRGEDLPPLTVQYKDYSVWQKEFFKTNYFKIQEEYWLKIFLPGGSGKIPILNIPTEFPRSSAQSFKADEISFVANKDLADGLNSIALKTGTTLFMVLLAGYNIFLSKYSGQEDIVVGVPVAGRSHADLEGIIGMFVNILALRNYPLRGKTITDFLEDVKQSSLGAYENQDYQFEKLVEKLGIERKNERNPLFDAMFVMQNVDEQKIKYEDLEFIPCKYSSKDAKVDITLEAKEATEGIDFTIEYRSGLFNRDTILTMIEDYLKILRVITEDRNIRLQDIELRNGTNTLKKAELQVEFNI